MPGSRHQLPMDPSSEGKRFGSAGQSAAEQKRCFFSSRVYGEPDDEISNYLKSLSVIGARWAFHAASQDLAISIICSVKSTGSSRATLSAFVITESPNLRKPGHSSSWAATVQIRLRGNSARSSSSRWS